MPVRIAVWDAPVRLFHWALALLVTFSFVSGHVAGSWLDWHMKSGYAILALVSFRILWGFAGGDTARFSSFVKGPGAAFAYARETFAGRHPFTVGHNPAGGAMVVVMVVAIFLQAFTGLFVDDEIATQGPLAAKVSGAVVGRMGWIHHYNPWLLVLLVAMHVTAIALYRKVLRTNLVTPMVTGIADAPEGTVPPVHRPAWVAALLFAASVAAPYWLVVVYPAAK